MTLYRLCLVMKLIGVALYAGGIVASFIATEKKQRQLAAHRVAGTGIALIWIFGYLLTLQLLVPLTELWILSGLVASFNSMLVVSRSASREKATHFDMAMAASAFVFALFMMVFRPTWAMVKH